MYFWYFDGFFQFAVSCKTMLPVDQTMECTVIFDEKSLYNKTPAIRIAQECIGTGYPITISRC